jgi:hypothetical protein
MESETVSPLTRDGADGVKQKTLSSRDRLCEGDHTIPTPSKGERLTRILAPLLMTLATMGSAWGGFQSGLWNGIQTFRLADASKLSRLSSDNTLLASQQRNVDAAGFMEYARAISENNAGLAEFVRDRMRPEFRPALDAWLATKPLKNKDAPSSPFLMEQYKLKTQQEATDEDRLSNSMHDQAQQANLNGDTYSLTVLLFTSALFLAGLLTGLGDSRTKWIMIVLSVVFISAAGVILFGLPIAHRG